MDCPAASILLARMSPTPDRPPSFAPICCNADASAGVMSPFIVILVRMLVTIWLPVAMSDGLNCEPMRLFRPCMPEVPIFDSMACCSSFSRDIEREEYVYPPARSTCGRYFVRTLFRVLVAMSFLTFAILSCLLFLSALALQESRERVSACTITPGKTVRKISNNRRITLYQNLIHN